MKLGNLYKKFYLRRSVAIFMIVMLFITPTALQPETVNAGSYALVVKEFALDLVARLLAQKVLAMVEGKLLDQVLKGNAKGDGPAWITNWTGFRNDARRQGLSKWQETVNIAAYGSEEGDYYGKKIQYEPSWCEYLREGLAPLFGAKKATGMEAVDSAPKLRNPTGEYTIMQTTQCTLPKKIVVNGIEKDFSVDEFRKDFAGNGGWETFGSLMQPENNYFNILSRTIQKKNDFADIAEQSKINEGVAGAGFECTTLDGGHEQCATPGKVLAETTQSLITKNLDWITNTDELSELVASLMGVMTGRLSDLCGNGGSDAPGSKCKRQADADLQTEDDAALNQEIKDSGANQTEQDCKDLCQSEAESACSMGDKSAQEEVACIFRRYVSCLKQLCPQVGTSPAPSVSPQETP